MEDAKQLFRRPPSLVLHVLLTHMPRNTHLPAQARMEDAKQLFRNQQTTEFVIVTIPTVMATAESCR